MTRHIFALAVIACFVVAGCAKSQSAPATTSPSPSPSAARRTVPVELDDYVIRMPASLPPGDVTFTVKNVGKHAHNIKIHGPDVDAVLPKNLRGGESGTLDVHLQPGTYRVTCPVGPHAMMGMRMDLTVKP